VEPVVENLPAQPGDVARTWAEIRKAERLLGYRPATSIEEGIPRFVEWFSSQAAAEAVDVAPPAPAPSGPAGSHVAPA
jgi:nucleoside-diphosphate-sugar epimerase